MVLLIGPPSHATPPPHFSSSFSHSATAIAAASGTSSATSLVSHLVSLPYYRSSAASLVAQAPTAIDQGPKAGRMVYAHQRELIVATASECDYIGSADATTCCIVIIVNAETKISLVTHLDGTHEEQIRGATHSLLAHIQLVFDHTTKPATHTSPSPSPSLATSTPASASSASPSSSSSSPSPSPSSTSSSVVSFPLQVHLVGCMDLQSSKYPYESIPTLVLQTLHQYSTLTFHLHTCCIGPLNTFMQPKPPYHTSITATATDFSPPPASAAIYRPHLTSLFLHLPTNTLYSRAQYSPNSRGPCLPLRCVRSFLSADHQHLSTPFHSALFNRISSSASSSAAVSTCLSSYFSFSPFVYYDLRPSYLSHLLSLSDEEFLRQNSTSPESEPAGFIDDCKSAYQLLQQWKCREYWTIGEGRKLRQVKFVRKREWDEWNRKGKGKGKEEERKETGASEASGSSSANEADRIAELNVWVAIPLEK